MKEYNEGKWGWKEREGRRRKWQGFCVKCGQAFRASKAPLPADPDARPRWSKFAELVTCPHCGDSKGHAGLFSPEDIEVVPEAVAEYIAEAKAKKPSPLALDYADACVREVINALSKRAKDETIDALMHHRGYPRDLAKWFHNLGVRFGTISDIRFEVSATTFAHINLPRSITDDTPLLWLPLPYIDGQGKQRFIGFQVRQLEKDAEPRYVTIRFTAQTPLVTVISPPANGETRASVAKVILTEGYFKAAVVAYRYNAIAIAALGAIAKRDAIEAMIDIALRYQSDLTLFTRTIVLAPDRDAREKSPVAKSTYQAYKALEQNGFRALIAIWDGSEKGIDDAILAGREINFVPVEVFLATLKRQIRDALFKTRVKTRTLLEYEAASALDLPETPRMAEQQLYDIYEAMERRERWLEALGKEQRLKPQDQPPVVIDISPAGTGKTHAAALLKRRDFIRAGIFAKRLVYIAPEVKRPAVQQLEKWKLFEGRDSLCPFYERLSELEREGLERIGQKVCSRCPVRRQCGYYAQKARRATYVRISWQSYSPQNGDIVIFDEWERISKYRSYTITRREFDAFLASVDRFGANREVERALKELREMMKKRNAEHEAIVSIFKAIPEHALDNLIYELYRLHSDIQKTREWSFMKTDERPRAFYWVEKLLRIVAGKKKGQVWIEDGNLRIIVLDSKFESLMAKASAILILDAHANPREAQEILKAPVTVVSSDEPTRYPRVIQVPAVTVTRRMREGRKREALKLAKVIVKRLTAMRKLPKAQVIGILTHKDAADAAREVFGKKAVVGWWGRDERATNIYYEARCNVLLVIGLPHRHITDIAAEQGKAGYNLKAFRKAKLDKDGNYWIVLKEYADPELARRVRWEADVAYLQAAGRLRQGRREEPCFMVVFDAEPLPEALDTIVIPPEEVLKGKYLEDYKRRQLRGFAVVNELKRKAATERLIKAISAVALYRALTNENPEPSWLARALGVSQRTAWRLWDECAKYCHTFVQDKDTPYLSNTYTECVAGFGTPPSEPTRPTLSDKDKERIKELFEAKPAYMHPPKWLTEVLLTIGQPSPNIAVAAFIQHGYPVPYRALARRYKTHHQVVKRIEKRMREHMKEHLIKPETPEKAYERIVSFEVERCKPPTTPYPCPECGTPLEAEATGMAACVGCGKAWQWDGDGFKPLYIPPELEEMERKIAEKPPRPT